MRCWERSAAEASAEEAGLSLNIDFRASAFLVKTVGRIKERREMSSVRLFCSGCNALVGLREGRYCAGEEDSEVCGEFHEFDVLLAQAVFEHVSLVEYADIKIEFLEPRTVFFRASREFIPFVSCGRGVEGYVVTMTWKLLDFCSSP
jgi:hypothetical protein